MPRRSRHRAVSGFDAAVVTAPLDAFAGETTALPWRGIRVEARYCDTDDPDGTVTRAYTVNQPDPDVPFTRTVETKHASGQRIPGTVVCEEYPGTRRSITRCPRAITSTSGGTARSGPGPPRGIDARRVLRAAGELRLHQPGRGRSSRACSLVTTSSAPADTGPAPAGPELWVVMPVFNEAAALGPVVGGRLPALTRCTGAVRLCVVDDGSTDATPAVLRELAAAHAEIEPVRRTNGGHGRACLQGYRLGLARGARWIAQIDSDGQCDASRLSSSGACAERHPVIFGHRRVRLDGWRRRLVSRTLALGAASATGVSVRDPNVPYRLVDAAVLRDAVDAVPGRRRSRQRVPGSPARGAGRHPLGGHRLP